MKRPFTHSQRGAALISALIFSVVIVTILGSVLSLSRQNVRASTRFFYSNAVVNLAETGIEYGLRALNAAKAGEASPWSGWTVSGNDAVRTFSNVSYGAGVTGTVKVGVVGYLTGTPTVVSRGRIILQDGQAVEKWIRVTVGTRGLFAYGLLARNTITASGGAYFDSWNSDPDNDPATPAIPYSAGVAGNNAMVATASKLTPAISIGSADLYGKVAVGADGNAGLEMSWGGQVGPRGMPISGPYNLAPDHLTPKFSATFETIPDPTGATVVAPYVLPRSVTGPPYYISAESFGSPGATTILQLNSLSVSGAATLTIRGDVTLFLPPSVGNVITVGGSGKIVLESGATLKIFTPGSIDISGAGMVNPNSPKNLQIWSTRAAGSAGQNITLSGSGALSGIIYAPDANFSIPGGTHLHGAAVIGQATFSGSGAFHFDESLKNFGSSGSLKITNYRELTTAAERAPYASILTF